MPEYIEVAAKLWIATQRKAQLEKEIERLQYAVEVAAIPVMLQYREQEPSYDDALTALSCLLQAREFQDWGPSMPDGLSMDDIQTATGFDVDQVHTALKKMRELCERGYDKTLIAQDIGGITRFRLVHDARVRPSICPTLYTYEPEVER